MCILKKDIIQQLDQCNHPKTELLIQEKDYAAFQVTLKHDEVKYICIKPS